MTNTKGGSEGTPGTEGGTKEMKNEGTKGQEEPKAQEIVPSVQDSGKTNVIPTKAEGSLDSKDSLARDDGKKEEKK